MKSPAQQMIDWLRTFGAEQLFRVLVVGDVSFVAPIGNAVLNGQTSTWSMIDVVIMTATSGSLLQPSRLVVKRVDAVAVPAANVTFAMDVQPTYFLDDLQQHVDHEEAVLAAQAVKPNPTLS